jgi:formimidoylglutamate deiminase
METLSLRHEKGFEMKNWKFKGVYLKEGWLSPAYIATDDSGNIVQLSDKSPSVVDEFVNGYAIAPVTNAHSHAFQYAMAGLTENIPEGQVCDNFWSWRDRMYRIADQITPEQTEAIATMLYAEMLRVGYDHVVEFHYLRNNKNGQCYDNPNEMSDRLISAAKKAGIKMTLVPVYYRCSDFGKGPSDAQRRFQFSSTDDYFKHIDSLISSYKNDQDVTIGFGLHSMRAATAEEIKEIISYDKELPCHLHISEQTKEVNACVDYLGARPVEWLTNETEVGAHCHLVHSTHITESEMKAVIKADANVVLCPTTEGNLGDGFFPIADYIKSGGRWCIGSDSHIALNPFEELRMLDYGQRLVKKQRNTLLNGQVGDSAECAYQTLIDNGRRAAGKNIANYFEVGSALNAIVIAADSPLMGRSSDDGRLATIVYALDISAIDGQIINGTWIVKSGNHVDKEKILSDFTKALCEIH